MEVGFDRKEESNMKRKAKGNQNLSEEDASHPSPALGKRRKLGSQVIEDDVDDEEMQINDDDSDCSQCPDFDVPVSSTLLIRIIFHLLLKIHGL